MYFGKGELHVQGYMDVDFGGEVDHRRITSTFSLLVYNCWFDIVDAKDSCFTYYRG